MFCIRHWIMLDELLKEALVEAYDPDIISDEWQEVLEECVVDLEEKDAVS